MEQIGEKFLPLEGRKTMHITNKASTAEVATPNTIFNHVYIKLKKKNQAYVQFLLNSWNDKILFTSKSYFSLPTKLLIVFHWSGDNCWNSSSSASTNVSIVYLEQFPNPNPLQEVKTYVQILTF